MSNLKELLAHRNMIKRKMPKFRRQNTPRIKRLRIMWKKPKGDQSKARLKLRGHTRQPSIGFSSPRVVRGLTREGFSPILINNMDDLKKAKIHIVLSRTLGERKKVMIVKKALEMKLTILNLKNPAEYLKSVEETLRKNKEISKSKEAKKKLSKEEALKKSKKEEKKPEEVSPEEKEKQAKEEKRKVLEQK